MKTKPSDDSRNFPVYNRTIYVDGRASSVRLILTGDWHYGAAACDDDELAAGLRWLGQQQDTYWFGMGDLADAIAFSDRRFDPRALNPTIWDAVGRNLGHYHDEVKRRLNRMVRPAGHNCLGLLEGNHEAAALRLAHSISVLGSLVDDYRDWERDHDREPNPHFAVLGDSAAVVLNFCPRPHPRRLNRGRSRLILFLTHGVGYAATLSGKTNRLEGVMAWLPDADIYACGHFHDEFVRPRPTLRIAHSPTAPRVVAVPKMFVLVPSFHRTYHGEPNYASRRLYPPSVLGWRLLNIKPFGDRRRLSGGCEFLRPLVSTEVKI